MLSLEVIMHVFCLILVPCLSLQGKKGRPGDDGVPGQKGTKVLPTRLITSCF